MQAQDLHFSQFNEHGALVNPALTGVDNSTKIVGVYKSQWRSVTVPYTTFGVSFESRLKPGGWEQVDKHRSMTFKERGMGRFAGGLSVYKDKAGDGSYDLTQANLSLCTFVPTGKKSFLSFGAQGNYSQRRLEVSALLFPDQYAGNGYSKSVPSKENFPSQNFSYGELAAGLVWSYKNKAQLATHEKTKVNLGISMYHINKAPQKFLSVAGSRIQPKYVFYGDFIFSSPNPRIVIAPKMLVQTQGPSIESVTGVVVKQYSAGGGGSKYTGIDKASAIGYGIYYRYNDAVILNMLYEWKEQFAAGLSYDINISRLAGTTTGRGGMELTLRYTPPSAYLYQMRKAPDIRKGSE